MHWATLFFTSELTFLSGSDVALFPVVPKGRRPLVRLLWGVRIALLAVAFTLIVEGASLLVVGILIGCAGLAYIGSWSYTVLGLDANQIDRFVWTLSHLSVINWALAFPYAVGSRQNGCERSLWLFINFVSGLILAGIALTDEPLNLAYSCYPPIIPTSELGSYGICPESRYGTAATCNSAMGGALTSYVTCDGTIGRTFGGGARRAAIYIAAASIGVYFVSIGRNRRLAAR